MIYVFYILAAVLIYFSYRSFRGGIAYLNFFKSEFAKPKSNFNPFVSIIVPCRGLDDGLEMNLSGLFRQDHTDYEVIFVVDDTNDPGVEVIREISSRAAKKTKLVIAQKATKSSQKVENLREAVLHVSNESKVFVFVDSDARPNESWLRNLVAPLEDKNAGSSTGYRWYVSNNPSFFSEFRSVWNASIASALGPNTKSNFCWGGSMAIRRDVFEKLDMSAKWDGTLSDDFTVTQAMKEAGLPIYFVPQALTASIENCSFHGLFEFTTRQMKITRVYAPKLWLMSFFGSGLFNLVLIWAFFIVLFSRANGLPVYAALTVIVLVSFFSIGKAWLRLMAAKLALPEHDKYLKRQFLPQVTLWTLAPALFFYNSAAALISRKMTWRGIQYEMISPNEIKVIDSERTVQID